MKPYCCGGWFMNGIVQQCCDCPTTAPYWTATATDIHVAEYGLAVSEVRPRQCAIRPPMLMRAELHHIGWRERHGRWRLSRRTKHTGGQMMKRKQKRQQQAPAMTVTAKCVGCGAKRDIRAGEVANSDVPCCHKCLMPMLATAATVGH